MIQKKIIIVFPWGIDKVLNKTNGAGVRVGLLANYLTDNGFNVTILSVGIKKSSKYINNIKYIQIPFSTNLIKYLFYAFAMVITNLYNLKIITLWIYYYFYYFDGSLKKKISKIIDEDSIVFLDYPFWSKLVYAVTPLFVLTNHDIIAKGWCRPEKSFFHKFCYNFFLKKEINSFQMAFRTVVVSTEEKEFFESFDIDNIQYVPNPISIPDLTHNKNGNNHKYKRFMRHNNLSVDAKIAIFIGSDWYPNKIAVNDIIRHIAPKCPQTIFYIIGACSKGQRSNLSNVFLLGIVSADLLDLFYRIASLVIIPLRQGTGMSIKTIEAMAYGKVVLSTAVGVRNINFQDQINGILCNSIKEFPEKIKTIFGRKKEMLAIGKNARITAKRYDYKIVYKPYLELINQIVQKKDSDGETTMAGR